MGRRTGVSSDDTRRELLEATARVLLRKGYAGTRVSEIAREAGVTTGAIYNHFSSKGELITAAIAAQAPHVLSGKLESGDGASVLDAFRTLAAVLPQNSDKLGPLMLELVVTATRDDDVADVLKPKFAEKESLAADAIRLAQDAGAVDTSIDAEAFARFLTMLTIGSHCVSALEMKPIDGTAWSGAMDRMLDGLRPRDRATASSDQHPPGLGNEPGQPATSVAKEPS